MVSWTGQTLWTDITTDYPIYILNYYEKENRITLLISFNKLLWTIFLNVIKTVSSLKKIINKKVVMYLQNVP